MIHYARDSWFTISFSYDFLCFDTINEIGSSKNYFVRKSAQHAHSVHAARFKSKLKRSQKKRRRTAVRFFFLLAMIGKWN